MNRNFLLAAMAATLLSAAPLAASAAPGNGPDGFNAPRPDVQRPADFRGGVGPDCPWFDGFGPRHHRGFYGSHHGWCGYGYGPRGAFGDYLEESEKYGPMLQEIREVQRLAVIEGDVLEAMINNPRYSVEEVRRQSGIVAGLEDQVRDKVRALHQALRDDDSFNPPRYRR